MFDNLKGRLYLIVHADPAEPQAYAKAQRRLDELVYRLRQSGRSYPDVLRSFAAERSRFRLGFHRSTDSPPRWNKPKEYIRAGDIFQVVLSQRMSVPFRARPVDVYRALRALNPSPYMYFLDLGGYPGGRLLAGNPGALPEQGEVTVRPIAGTRPRGTDAEARRSGAGSRAAGRPKERAEHLMLIDLGRNDVGRVSEAGQR